MKILVMNGPNLNLLGIREPQIYGSGTYKELCELIQKKADLEHVTIDFYQSNHEGKIIDVIHRCLFEEKVDGIIINPGAYSHYSYAIYDALVAVQIPTVEVHISNINSREEFRQRLVTGKAAMKIISGKGFVGYVEALQFLVEYLRKEEHKRKVQENKDQKKIKSYKKKES